MISNIIPKINENYSRHITIVDNFLENPDEIDNKEPFEDVSVNHKYLVTHCRMFIDIQND